MSQLFVSNPRPKKPYSPRRKNDFYETPLAFARAGVGIIQHEYQGTVTSAIDPGCGTGRFGQALRERYPNILLAGYEIREEEPHQPEYSKWYTQDYLKSGTSKVSVVIGNPPFSLAEQFLYKSLGNLKEGGIVVFLLGLNFLSTQGRYTRMYSNPQFCPKSVYVLPKRPSFFNNGSTNASEYAYYVWQQGARTSKPELKFLLVSESE